MPQSVTRTKPAPGESASKYGEAPRPPEREAGRDEPATSRGCRCAPMRRSRCHPIQWCSAGPCGRRRPDKATALAQAARALTALTEALSALGGVPLDADHTRAALTWSAQSTTSEHEMRRGRDHRAVAPDRTRHRHRVGRDRRPRFRRAPRRGVGPGRARRVRRARHELAGRRRQPGDGRGCAPTRSEPRWPRRVTTPPPWAERWPRWSTSPTRGSSAAATRPVTAGPWRARRRDGRASKAAALRPVAGPGAVRAHRDHRRPVHGRRHQPGLTAGRVLSRAAARTASMACQRARLCRASARASCWSGGAGGSGR